jgi:hypothetical protein
VNDVTGAGWLLHAVRRTIEIVVRMIPSYT